MQTPCPGKTHIVKLALELVTFAYNRFKNCDWYVMIIQIFGQSLQFAFKRFVPPYQRLVSFTCAPLLLLCPFIVKKAFCLLTPCNFGLEITFSLQKAQGNLLDLRRFNFRLECLHCAA